VDSISNDHSPTPREIPEDIADALNGAAARLGIFRDRISWFEEIASTNAAAAVVAGRGAPEGTVIAANTQTSGRGRLGRTWASPPGAGLYVSLVLRPRPSVVPLLTIAAGVALADGIEAGSGLRIGLKWPNDLVVGRRKLGGILSEAISLAASAGPIVDRVVVGFGINLRTATYPPDVEARATSIERELGRPSDRGLVLAECLAACAATYNALQNGHADTVVAAWRTRAADHLGRHVEWDDGAGLMRGVAQDIDAAGALLVRIGHTTVRVISGEVRWL
jgi:BirA family biotin operon repressor/biotin-[acetyl-CoA-carboxylase] ligase